MLNNLYVASIDNYNYMMKHTGEKALKCLFSNKCQWLNVNPDVS